MGEVLRTVVSFLPVASTPQSVKERYRSRMRGKSGGLGGANEVGMGFSPIPIDRTRRTNALANFAVHSASTKLSARTDIPPVL